MPLGLKTGLGLVRLEEWEEVDEGRDNDECGEEVEWEDDCVGEDKNRDIPEVEFLERVSWETSKVSCNQGMDELMERFGGDGGFGLENENYCSSNLTCRAM